MASSRTVAALVTRPEREAAQWTQALRARGVAAEPLPLIAIRPTPAVAPLQSARESLGDFAAAMFVSANAVDGLMGADQRGGALSWPAQTRAWAAGPGTRDALLAAGVPSAQIDAPGPDAAQFDSETLWALVRGQVGPGHAVLIARGGDALGNPTGRDWLAGQLEAAGVEVRAVAAYARQRPDWSDAQRARAAAASHDGSWWIFSSSEAVGNLRALMPGQGWSAARAVCTHPRIATAAQAAGFGVVNASRPLLADVAAFLQSNA